MPGYNTPDETYLAANGGGGARGLWINKVTDYTVYLQSQKYRTGTAPFRYVCQAALLNSMHYCRDQGDSMFFCAIVGSVTNLCVIESRLSTDIHDKTSVRYDG